MNKTLFLLMFAVFLFPALFFADDEVSTVITLNDFIVLSVQNHPDIFAELAELKEAEALSEQAEAIYDVLVSASLFENYSQSADPTASNMGIVDQKIDYASGDISGLLPDLGAAYSVGVSLSQVDAGSYLPTYDSILGAVESGTLEYTFSNTTMFTPSVEFQYTQSLLKNWLGVIDKYPVVQADLNEEITGLSVDEAVETVIIELYELYFDWYQSYNSALVFRESVSNSLELMDQIERKMTYQLADESDYLSVQILNAEYQKAILLLNLTTEIYLKKIYHWMYGTTVLPEGESFVPEDEILLPEIPDREFTVEESRQYEMLVLGDSLLEYQLKKEKNEMLPDLDLVLQFSLSNPTFDPYSVFDGGNFSDNYYIGLQFSTPIGQNLETGAIEATKAQMTAWDEQTDSFVRLFTQSLIDLKTTLEVYESMLIYDDLLVEYSEDLVTEEKAKYEQGRSDLYYIVQYEDNWVQYQITRIQDEVDTAKVQLQFLALVDELFTGVEE